MNVGELIEQARRYASSLMPCGHMPCGQTPSLRVGRALFNATACMLLATLSLAAQNSQVFKGQICVGAGVRTASVDKSQVTAPCTVPRARRGVHYVLSNLQDKTVYQLDGPKRPQAFAGNNVLVVGSLDKDTGTIHVNDILRALPPLVTRAKSIYIDCDACPREMATAWLAAFGALTDWARFDVVPDPRKADLVLLLSANPYLGDYITRDGPDKRPVKVDITYMDVVDPRTGESLWSDSRQWGAWFVSRATKDLISGFKEELAFQERAAKD